MRAYVKLNSEGRVKLPRNLLKTERVYVTDEKLLRILMLHAQKILFCSAKDLKK